MINGSKVVVVMPAYNAEETLRRTVKDIDGSRVIHRDVAQITRRRR